MKKGLLKIRNLVIFFIIIVGCKNKTQKDFYYSDFQKIKESHSITNEFLKDSLKNILNNQLKLHDFEHPIYILDVEKVKERFIFCFTKTDFLVFKSHRGNYFEKPIGFVKFEGIPLLLFGNIDNVFFKKENKLINERDILGNLPIYDKNNPPILYDPNFISFEMK